MTKKTMAAISGSGNVEAGDYLGSFREDEQAAQSDASKTGVKPRERTTPEDFGVVLSRDGKHRFPV